MAKKKITEIIEEISAEFLAQNGLELYNSEFVKEGRDWFLRVYIDKMQEAQEAAKAEIAAASERAAEAAESGGRGTAAGNLCFDRRLREGQPVPQCGTRQNRPD